MSLWGNENKELVKESLEKALKGETAQFNAICNTAKGTVKWWDVVVSPVGKPNEPIQQIISVSRDITHKIEEQHRLKLLESVITNTKDAILITEAEPLREPGPRIIYVNEAFTRMTGYEANEVIGKSPRILQGPNSNKEELAELSKSLHNWEPCETTTINYKKNGDEFWINFTVTPVADKKGIYTHWIAVERDVTEQKNKELQKELFAQISQNFKDKINFPEATRSLCKTISDFGDFDLVELWIVNIEKSHLNLLSHHLNHPESELFYEGQQGITSFEKKESLPGTVWAKGEQIVWNEIDDNNLFIRKAAAQKIQLKSVVGIPLVFQNEVIGVLLIGTKQETAQLVKHTWLFKQLEEYVGSELSRKKIENDLNHLYDTIPDIICIVDFQGRFMKINKAGCNLLGYQEEDILLSPLDQFVHPDDRHIYSQAFQYANDKNHFFSLENRCIAKDGSLIWLSWYCTISKEEGLVYITARNITDEKKLRELNRLSGKLAKIGSWEVDLINQTIFWSEEVHQLHETNSSIFIPELEQAIQFYKEEYQVLVRNYIENSIITGQGFDFEAILITVTKKERWVRAIGTTEFTNGKCTKIFGSFQDISDRKEAEVRLQSLADNLPGVVFQYHLHPDGSDALKFVTQGATKVWGFPPEEVLANNQLVWEQIQKGGQIEEVKKSIVHAIQSKTNWTARWKYLLPGGEVRTHMGLGSPNFTADGTIIFNSVILDVTQEVKNENLLNEVSKIAKIGSWESDLFHNEHYKSSMVDEILEMEPHQFIHDMASAIEFCREDFQTMVHSKFIECIKYGKDFDFEAVIVTAAKNEKWVRVIGRPKMLDGYCRKIYGSIQDISSLKETETRLLSISENLPGVVYQYLIFPDGTDALRYVSGAVEQLWGFTADQVLDNINLLWDQVKAGGNYEETKASILKSIQTKSKWTTRFKYMMPTGELRTHLGNGTPSFLADGTILFNSIILDITQEVRNEEMLEQTTELARIGSWEMDLMNKNAQDTMYWSPMIKKLLEIDEDDENTLSAGLAFFSGESRMIADKVTAELMQKGQEFDEDLLLISAKGNERWIRAIGKCERANDTIVKIFGSVQDIHEQKIAEHKKNSLQATLEYSLNEIYIFDAETWYFIYVNKGAIINIGYSDHEIKSLTPLDLKPDFTATSFKKLVAPLESNEKDKIIFFTNHKRKNGSFYPVEVHLQLVQEGSNRRFLAIILDITERKYAEEQVAKAFTEKNNILERITEAFVSLDTNWCYTFMNKKAGGIFNCDPDKMIGKHIWTEFPEGKNQPFHLAYEKAMATQQYIYLEEHYPPYDLWFENHIYPSSDGLSIFFRDISDRKINEENLRKLNERFEKATEATQDAIWDWDIVNDIFIRSKNIKNFFGEDTPIELSPEHFWQDKFNPNDLKNLKDSIQTALANPETSRWQMEYKIYNQKNEELFVVDRGVITRDENGKPIRMVGAMTNLTNQKKLEKELLQLNNSLNKYSKELERSNEELEQFAFITSHDLQEPLRMISSFMDLLKRRYGDQLDEKALQYIYYATDGAQRMKQIILDLLEYSRANRPSEGLEEVDLNEIISDFIHLRRKSISTTSASIHFEKLPILKSYKAAIIQIFHCLLDNALKYARDGVSPIIKIEVVEKEHEWEFSITDNGIGIDPNFFDKIFIIFQRLHNRDKFQGTGIGLSIVKRSVEFLGGKIWLSSKIGEGTTFFFSISKLNK